MRQAFYANFLLVLAYLNSFIIVEITAKYINHYATKMDQEHR